MVAWTNDKNFTLLVGIMEYQGITMSAGLLKHLADKIGDGCTPKAVTHQLSKIKAAASGGKASTSVPATPKKAGTTPIPKTPGTTGKRRRPATTNDYGTPSKTKSAGGMLAYTQDSFFDNANTEAHDELDEELERMSKKIKIKRDENDEDDEHSDLSGLQNGYI